MGCIAYITKERFTGLRPIPLKIVNEVRKSICKIIIKNKEGNNMGVGTGFLLNFQFDLFLYLLLYLIPFKFFSFNS